MSRPQDPSAAAAESSKELPPPRPPARPIVMADLNVDPPESDAYASPPPPCTNNSNEHSGGSLGIEADETTLEHVNAIGRDVEALDVEVPISKKVGKFRSKASKVENSSDLCGTELDAEQINQGVTAVREEKVSSIKTGLIHVARKMPKNMHAHFILGLMYQRMGQPQKAIPEYEKAEEILLRSEEEIDRPELLSVVQVHRAQCILLESFENCSSEKELDSQELDKICCKIKESMESDDRQASVWNTLGILLLRTGRLQSAISVFTCLLEIAPGNLNVLGNLGVAYLQGGYLELSEKCFQDLVLKDQNHPAALVNYSASLLYKYGSVMTGESAYAHAPMENVMAVNVAKECLLAAVQTEPKAAHIWTNLSNAYYLIGDHRTGGKCLEKAGKLDPNCLATRYAVGVHRVRGAERSQNPNEQLTWAGNEMASIIREGESIIDPPVSWAGLALVHKAQHEIVAAYDIDPKELEEVKERAMHSLKQSIGEDPGDAIQWHQIGLHCLSTQEFQTSQTYLKAAIARLNDCVYAWSNLGISLQLLESSQAEKVYKHALSLASSQHAHAIFSNLGNLYRQLAKFETAKAMFSKALELKPGYAPAYNNLGLVFVAEGLLEEAKFCFNKAIESDPLLDAAKSNMVKVAAKLSKRHKPG